MSGPAGEQVLVVPRAVLMADPGWYGLHPAEEGAFGELVERHGAFRDRAEMEFDRSFKQVIPYLVVRDGARYFLMRRTRAGGDARLHDRWSIGVGGHLNPGDRDITGGLRREWQEEIEADFIPRFRLVGLLNDDTTDVGSVHVGAVHVADVRGAADRIRIRETEKLEGAFVDASGVEAVADRLESWSLIVFRALEGGPAERLAEPG